MTYVLAPNQTVEVYPYSIVNLKRDNPNVSFSKTPSVETLANYDVFPVLNSPAPSFDQATQRCYQVHPTLQNGQWVETWEVATLSNNDIAERLASKSSDVRMERNHLLSQCDWTQASDSPLSADDKAAWAAYRQSLRDLTSAAGFPFTMTWPTAP